MTGNNNQNQPMPPASVQLTAAKKWYRHKAVIPIVALAIITVFVSWLALDRQFNANLQWLSKNITIKGTLKSAVEGCSFIVTDNNQNYVIGKKPDNTNYGDYIQATGKLSTSSGANICGTANFFIINDYKILQQGNQQKTTMPVNNVLSPLCILDKNGLPPDPGEAGKQTLEGIDCDHDGVRDDVQRYIAVTYPDSARSRAAAMQYVLSLEAYLTDANSAPLSKTNAKEMAYAIDCWNYNFMKSDADVAGGLASYKLNDALTAIVLNTADRTYAYYKADSQLGAMFDESTPYAQKVNHCLVNPSTLPN